MAIIVNTSEVEPKSRFAGVISRPMLDQNRGAGAVTLSELTVKPGAVLPPHTHIVEEAFFVFQGLGEAIAGEEVSPVSPGTALLAPAGTAHGFRNVGSEDLKIVCMYPAVNPVAFFGDEKP